MADVMYRVRLTEDGPERWTNGAGWYADQSNPVITNLTAEQAESLVDSRPYFEHVDASPEPASSEESDGDADEDVEAPFDPAEYNVDDLEAELDANDYSGAELAALEAAEADGKDRETALDAIRDAQEE